MPPRHGKSMTVTETFPSWFIGKCPDKRVIEVSYNNEFAEKFGRRNRSKIEEFGKEIFGIEVSRENRNATNWSIHGRRGGMLSSGIGGRITGEGADLLIIDDPVKNRAEADSITYRDRFWDEWQNTLLTRLQPGAAVIIILTRWHEDDIVGRLLARDNMGEWLLLNMPAIAEDDGDILGRSVGEALWPEHGYCEEWAEKMKKDVGSRTWESLYQGRPSAAEGTIFQREWWKHYTNSPSIEAPHMDEIIQSWDMTFKDSESNDYVVGQVWGKLGADRYLLDQVRGRMDFPATLKAIRTLKGKWQDTRAIYVEDTANGPAVIATLKHDIQGLIPVKPEGGKIVRAQAVTAQIEAGNVYLPQAKYAPWLDEFLTECTTFPSGKNDDQVDAMTQALAKMAVRGGASWTTRPEWI